jgi:hypothetical protein
VLGGQQPITIGTIGSLSPLSLCSGQPPATVQREFRIAGTEGRAELRPSAVPA